MKLLNKRLRKLEGTNREPVIYVKPEWLEGGETIEQARARHPEGTKLIYWSGEGALNGESA